MSINGQALIGWGSESDSSLELEELPPFWELKTSGCFRVWNNSSIADSGLIESFHF
jgi:hypothetical protein